MGGARYGARAVVLIAAVMAVACSRSRAPRGAERPDPGTRRTTTAGEVVGAEGAYGSHVWYGVPYAAPPVGERRWRRAVPPAAWSGARPAIAPGAPCPQYTARFSGVEGPSGAVVGDEDCLTLTVWTPRFPDGRVPAGADRKPVMVWIHGGGHTIGQTGFYDGGNLAATHGLVVIAVQYRLGPFGWFRHAALRAGAADAAEGSGNFGTLDLVRALAWVRDNAAAFGGDPGNVTIFGESAGGTNVFTLLLAPQARGLFHRAIVQSGGLTWPSAVEAEAPADASPPGHAQSASEIVLRLLQRDGAPDRAAAQARLAGMDPGGVAAFLRSRTTGQVMKAYMPEPTGMIDLPGPIGDGVVLPVDGFAALRRADGWNRVPVVLGTNRDENKLFMFAEPHRIRRVLWVIPRFVDEDGYLASADYLARSWKAAGADEPAAALRAHSDRVFVYRFDWDEEPTRLGADLSRMLGAAHFFEIPFVFGHFDLGREANAIFTDANRPGREALARAMMSYWAAFARDGDPGRGITADLPAWTARPAPDRPAQIVFDTPAGGGIRMTAEEVRRDALLAAVDTDPRLRTPRARCGVLRELASWSRAFTRAQYAARPECAALPFDGYPWAG